LNIQFLTPSQVKGNRRSERIILKIFHIWSDNQKIEGSIQFQKLSGLSGKQFSSQSGFNNHSIISIFHK
jgi:hypothetical protein